MLPSRPKPSRDNASNQECKVAARAGAGWVIKMGQIHARLPTSGNDDEDRLDGIWKRLGIVGKNGVRPRVCRECSSRGQHESGLGSSKQDTHVQAVSDETHSAE